jgi:phosphoglycolate phosphatase
MPARTALVFDLDGTLVDTAPDLHRALNAVLAEGGRAAVPLADIRHMVGDGALKMIERGYAATGAPVDPAELPRLFRRFLEIYSAGGHAQSPPFPGVRETLVELRARGCRLAVCTNKPLRPSLEILDVLGLTDLFAAVLGGDSLPMRKPDPGHLLGTLERLGAGPDQAVMIGDSMNDVAVARAAAVPSVIVTYGYTRLPPRGLGGDVVIDAFAELLPALARPPLAR